MQNLKLFLKNFPPSGNLEKANADLLSEFKEKLPTEIIYLWENMGFGNYANGFLKLINPLDYHEILMAWLGMETPNYTRLPFLMTAFGDLFYLRLHDDGLYDISILDIHYREVAIVEEDIVAFLSEYLVDKQISEQILRKPLFFQALEKLGETTAQEIYFFAPALVLGGAEELNYLEKGSTEVHQQILLQI